MFEAKHKCIVFLRENFVGPVRPGDAEWVGEETTDLLSFTKDRQFLCHGDPHKNATLLVKYASFAQQGGHCTGFGSFA